MVQFLGHRVTGLWDQREAQRVIWELAFEPQKPRSWTQVIEVHAGKGVTRSGLRLCIK